MKRDIFNLVIDKISACFGITEAMRSNLIVKP